MKLTLKTKSKLIKKMAKREKSINPMIIKNKEVIFLYMFFPQKFWKLIQ
jgi:hypothetical protein